jgi:hypothetical protein
MKQACSYQTSTNRAKDARCKQGSAGPFVLGVPDPEERLWTPLSSPAS